MSSERREAHITIPVVMYLPRVESERREAHITIPVVHRSEDTEAVVPSSNIREGLGLRLVD